MFLYGSIVVYCGVLSLDLLQAWQHDLYADTGGWVFGLWLVLVLKSYSPEVCSPAVGRVLQVIAIVFGTIGLLGQLNVIQHLGLACAVCSLPLSVSSRVLLLGSSIFWMPMFGWCGHQLLLMNLNVARIPLMILTAIILFLIHKRQPSTRTHPCHSS